MGEFKITEKNEQFGKYEIMKKINIVVFLIGVFGFLSSAAADTAPGLTFEITAAGSGSSAALGQRATLHYVGKLEDGSVFDS